MNASKQTHEVAHQSPHAFQRVNMDFTDAIAIIIACPFFVSMTNGAVGAVNVVIALPFISVDTAILFGEPRYLVAQGLTVAVLDHAQADFTSVSAHCADNRRTVIGIRAMPAPFIIPPTRWVIRVQMRLTFF